MKDWQDDPLMRAAAFEGLAENEAFPVTERLDAARQAIKILREVVEEKSRDSSAD